MTTQIFTTSLLSLDGAKPLEPRRAPGGRALVLGGGGSAGNAWLLGVVAGLYESGADLSCAELTVGTSAGSTAAAQIHGTNPLELLKDIYDAGPGPSRPVHPSAPANGRIQAAGKITAVNHLERTARIIAESADAADMRRRMGAGAMLLDGGPDGEWQRRWRTIVAARLPSQSWPENNILLTAVNAETGEPVVFNRRSGVELADAVAASCCSGVPYRIRGSWFIDGGYRRNENADLASGYGRVLVLSPLGGRTRHPQEWGLQLATQVAELEADGSRVETLLPNEASLDAFGNNLMDPSSRLPAAQAGHAQGVALAARVADFWD